MEAFHIQLACIIAGVLLVGFWIYKSKKKVNLLSEELMDKKIVINELAEHASKMEKEVSSVVGVKPIKTVNKKPQKTSTKKISKDTAKKSTKTTAKKPNKKLNKQ
jgi:FtsZ-interacting cell division protein ZipA